MFRYSALSDGKVYPPAPSIEEEVQVVLSLGHLETVKINHASWYEEKESSHVIVWNLPLGFLIRHKRKGVCNRPRSRKTRDRVQRSV